MAIVFCNGTFIDENEPCIPINDRGFLYGDAIFTTIKVVDGVPLVLEEHLSRLKSQCKTIGINPPDILSSDINDLVFKNNAIKGSFRLKIIVTGGDSPQLDLKRRNFGKLLMTIAEIESNPLTEIKLTIFPKPINRPTAKLKSLSYLDRLFIMDYAKFMGFDDAIVLSGEGFVMETAFSNIFWVEGSNVFIPDPSLDLLMGVTLTHHMEILKNSGHNIHYVKHKLVDISPNSKIFVCNSIKEIVPAFIIS